MIEYILHFHFNSISVISRPGRVITKGYVKRSAVKKSRLPHAVELNLGPRDQKSGAHIARPHGCFLKDGQYLTFLFCM